MGCFCGQKLLWQTYGPYLTSNLPPDLQTLWQATYQRALTGNEATFQQVMQTLQAQNLLARCAAICRANQPLFAEALSPDTLQTLAHWSAEANKTSQYQGEKPYQKQGPLALALVAVCVVLYYARQWLAGDAARYDTLYAWGAVFYPAIQQTGQWWRLLTASFTHANDMHLWFNSSVLWLWGTHVEVTLGKRWLLGFFLGASLLGLLAELWLFQQVEPGYPKVMLGASAGVMGLLGVRLGMALRGWLQHDARQAADDVKGLIWLVVIQGLMDTMTPGVAAHAHLAGFMAGLLLYVLAFFPQFGLARLKTTLLTLGVLALCALWGWGSLLWLKPVPVTANRALGFAVITEATGQTPDQYHWIIKAASLGQPDAAYFLAVSYYKGQYMPKSLPKAFKWWQLAAQNGHLAGQYATGWCYISGLGVKADAKQAEYWLNKATANPTDGPEKKFALEALKQMGQNP